MDARGHGDSSKPEGDAPYAWHEFGDDALAVARVLAGEHPDGRVSLALGHSFGGTSLLLAASQDAEIFERLVMVDPVIRPPAGVPMLDPERAKNAIRLAEKASKRREVFGSREEARESWRTKSLFERWTPRAFELYLEEGLADRPDGQVELKCPSAVEAAIFSAGPDFDAWEVASRVTIPTLVLWAEQGDFPRVAFETLVERMAEARILDVDAGHLVTMERPDVVSRAVLEFAAPRRAPAQRSTG
jgi:pimeloyl-ACP methyl ester carboxylesterase